MFDSTKGLSCLIALLCLFLSGCPAPKPAPEPVPEPEATDTRYAPEDADQVMAGIDNFLGKGYRGYQYYANPESCTVALFDLSDPQLVLIQQAPSYKGRFVSGETKSEFFDQLSGSVTASGTYEGFSAEVTSQFSQSALRNRSHSFITSHISQTYYRLTIGDAAELLPEAAKDIAEMPPTALFDKYGTHFLQSIYLGSRISFSSFVDRSTVTKNFDLKASVDAAYLLVIKGSASGGTVNKSDVSQVVSNKQISILGGDPALANLVIDGLGDPAADFNAWSVTVPDYMSISDFAENGMVPLYTLAKDPQRQSELKLAWEKYMAAKTDPLLLEAEPEPIHKNMKFTLQNADDGRFYGDAPYNATYDYYYPKLNQHTAQTLQFSGNGDPLLSGHIVHIKTTEDFRGISKKWKDRVFLGAFSLKPNLYYWTDYDAKTRWFIEKAIPSADTTVRSGDTVYIRNEHFDQYITPHQNGFLTTTDDPHGWVITKVE